MKCLCARAPLRVEAPFNPVDSSVSSRCDGLEETRAKINVLKSASPAGIHNLSFCSSTGGWVEEGDGLAAEGVGVGIWSVLHHWDGESDDGFAVVVDDTAGAETRSIVRDITSVGKGCPSIEWDGRSEGGESGDEGNDGEMHGWYWTWISKWGSSSSAKLDSVKDRPRMGLKEW